MRSAGPDATGERLKVASTLPWHFKDGLSGRDDGYM
jgi:hypothetical protein